MSSTTSRPVTGRSDQRGQVLVLFAGGLVALLLVAALAFDVGMMLVERRDEQNAADAAALAGARFVLDRPRRRGGRQRDEIALINGYDDADPNEVVNVHIPAIHGRYVGLPGFIEVQIESTRPSIFGGVIGRATWPIGAFAVATNSQNLTFPFSMLALNPTACKAIHVSGGGVVESYENIQSNSSGADCTGGDAGVGFSRTGGSTIDVLAPTATCRSVGLIQDQGSGSMTCTTFAELIRAAGSTAQPAGPRQAGAADPGDGPGRVTPTRLPDHCPGATPSSKAPSEASPQTAISPPPAGSRTSNGSSTRACIRAVSRSTRGPRRTSCRGSTGSAAVGSIVKGDGSIVTIATEADANANVALATWGGGVMIYNSKLPAAPGGEFHLNGQWRDGCSFGR